MGRLHKKMMETGLTEEEQQTWQDIRARVSQNLMDADMEALFEFKEPNGPVPKKARIMASLICEDCGESVMESRTRRMHEKTLCLPCFEALEKRY